MNDDVIRIMGWTLEASGTTDELVDEWEVGEEDERQVLLDACPYTADDLIAWVAERCGRADWAFGHDGEQFFSFAFWITGYDDPEGHWQIEAEDPTILGCLEQLVIKIESS